MKKFTSLLFLIPLLCSAQINVDNNWKNLINPAFQNLDKTRISSGMLLDYAMEFTNVTAYNGALTDSTFIDINVMGDIYKTLFMSKVVADTVHTPLFDRYAYNWAKARFKATKDSTSVYVLSGLLYEYQQFNTSALAQNKITISANQYFDKYTNGAWQNPYETKRTFALTTPIQHSNSKNVSFKLPNSLFLSNIDSQIASIQIDADNGLGYQNFPFDTALQLQFFENKVHNITYKITLTNNQVLYCRSKFKIDDPTILNVAQRGGIVVNNERVYVYEDGNFFNAAWLTIRRIPGNTQITRPIIIAEGLDTGNFTAPEEFGGERTMANFINDVNASQSNNFENLLIRNNTQQYDLIYIDWVRGMADMRANSLVLEEVIKWVNAQKVISGSTQPNVLLGQSMGGVIGRYTLARMEKEGKTHNVRLFISHDSPMQGANVPLSFSHFANHMKSEYTNSPLAWTIGEVIIPVGMGLGQLGSSILNVFGANTSVPTFVTPSQILSLQDQTASLQLNYWSAVNLNVGNPQQTRIFNQDWQQTLTTMGWPTQSRNVAISNGNECSVDNGFAPGAPLLNIDSRSNPGFWLDMLNVVLAPFAGVQTLDLGLVLVGAMPGRSRWQSNFDFNSYGVQGSQNQIYRGRIRFEKKLLWIGPTIIHNLTNKTFNAPAEALPFETYSGGRVNLNNIISNIPIVNNLANVLNPLYGFIPVVSSLDIKRNNGPVNPPDYLKKYAGGATPEPALTSGFNNFIVDFNENNPVNNEHISFQARNGNWLAQELQVNPAAPVYPVVNCSFICATNQITGNSAICAAGSYSAPSGAAFYNWTITQGAANVTLQGNGTRNITLIPTPGASGQVILSLTMGGGGCGNVTITKTIWAGRPGSLSANSNITGPTIVATGALVGYQINSPLPQGATSYEWMLPHPYETVQVFDYFGQNWQKMEGSVDSGINVFTGYAKINGLVQVMGKNECGCGGAKMLAVQHSGRINGGGGGPGGGAIPRMAGPIESNIFTIFPNPATDIINIELRSKTDKPDNKADISATLYNLVGQEKAKIKINNNKASIPTATLTKGLYVLQIGIDGNIETHHIGLE